MAVNIILFLRGFSKTEVEDSRPQYSGNMSRSTKQHVG
jgi:hypothetical protein